MFWRIDCGQCWLDEPRATLAVNVRFISSCFWDWFNWTQCNGIGHVETGRAGRNSQCHYGEYAIRLWLVGWGNLKLPDLESITQYGIDDVDVYQCGTICNF